MRDYSHRLEPWTWRQCMTACRLKLHTQTYTKKWERSTEHSICVQARAVGAPPGSMPHAQGQGGGGGESIFIGKYAVCRHPGPETLDP